MTNFLDRLLARPIAKKATYGGVLQATYANDLPLSVYGNTPQEKAAAYLRAYKVGWFYKGGKKIAGDVAGLARTLSYEDTEGDNADEITVPPLMVPWEQLDPLEQFLRLMERPNPYQTGRTLFTKTEIRLDFAGMAFWYLENGEGGQLPTGLYGIGPARMWPSINAQGQLIGWVMDKDAPSGGVPFSVDEILPFIVPGVDEDPWCGQGVVEAVYANVPLSEQMARHTSNVLATGGRLAGMIWPKDRALSEDEYADAQKAWRNVASDPNAAKRMLVFPEPMEYASGASSPAEIGIPELGMLSRDEILTAFPISPYQLGVPMPGGLNSAETRKEDRHDYWEGTIHPRVELLEETIQWGLVNRYESAVGRALDFDIEEPNLDDAPSIIEKVGALKGLVSVGFDPKEAVAAVGLDHIQWMGLPDLLDPAKQAEMAQQAADAKQTAAANGGMNVVANDTNHRDQAATTQTVVGKAKITRDDVIGPEFPGLHAAVQAFLTEQQARVVEQVTATFPGVKSTKAWDDWWNAEAENLAFLNRLRGVYLALGRGALQVVTDNTGRIISGKSADRVLEDMLSRAGLRIADINETTRKTIADTLTEGTRRGYSLRQLISGVEGEGYGGVHGALMANGVTVWDPYRAEVIARTETMNAYNTAALVGYKDVNVRMVIATDGDKDDLCATRDGEPFTIDDALLQDEHPNGTLDWIPDSKSIDVDLLREPSPDYAVLMEAIKALGRVQEPPVIHVHQGSSTVNLPEQKATEVHVSVPESPAPIVNVAATEVHVPAPVINVTPEVKAPDVFVTSEAPDVTVNVAAAEAPGVTVNVPEQAAPVVNVTVPEMKADVTVKVPPIKATMSGEMRITGMPDRVTRSAVQRDGKGAITETTQVETDG